MPRKRNPIPHVPDPKLRTVTEHLFRQAQPEWFVAGVIEGLLSHLPKFKHKNLMMCIDDFYKGAGGRFAEGWEDSERTQLIARTLRGIRFKRGMVADHDHEVVRRHASDVISCFASRGFPRQSKNRRLEAWDHWLQQNIAFIAAELQTDPCICSGKLNRLLRKNKPAIYNELKHHLDTKSIEALVISIVAYHHSIEPATVWKIIFPKKIKVDFSELRELQRKCRTHKEFLAELKTIILSGSAPAS